MTKVAIISTKDRIYGVNKSLELLDINPVKDKNVVFKPNFNTADPPPASSSIETVKQIIVKLKEMGAKSIIVAERSGPADTAEVFKKKGLNDLAEEMGFKIVNLDDIPTEEYVLKKPENSHWKEGFLFAKIYDDAECIIETCCLKTHMYGGHFTLSLKNAVGMVSKKYMGELHSSSEFQRDKIAEINSVYKTDLIVMDGIITFVDGGPMQGTRVEANIFVAGTDKVAMDAVGVAILRILGTTPDVTNGAIFDQAQIKRAIELNIGIASPLDIELIGDSKESEDLIVKIKEKLSE
ncbi:hypothetical protein LCGC14_0554210 [marine sediment metagenome]|uniref:DUF362 domain-containing protein n=1 Tax=marine sediment metagenome TaxID=412755 RepID=A0A0F9S7I7_9ZZZZ